MINGLIFVVSFIHRTIGFEDALIEVKKLYLPILFAAVGILFTGYLIYEFN